MQILLNIHEAYLTGIFESVLFNANVTNFEIKIAD